MQVIDAIFADSTAESEIKDPFFTFNSKLLKFSHGEEIYPVANLTKLGVYTIVESKIPIIIMVLSMLFGLGFLFSGVAGLFILGVLCLSLFGFGIYQRKKPGKYVFGFTCASGEKRYLFSKNKVFLMEVVNTLTYAIENEDEKVKYSINMENVEITDLNANQVIDKSVNNTGVVGGNVTT